MASYTRQQGVLKSFYANRYYTHYGLRLNTIFGVGIMDAQFTGPEKDKSGTDLECYGIGNCRIKVGINYLEVVRGVPGDSDYTKVTYNDGVWRY